MNEAVRKATPPDARQDPEPALDPLHCVEVVELVTDYLEGTLTPDEIARLDAHLAVCEPCARYVEQVRETIRGAGRVEPETVPPEVLHRLLGIYRELRGS